MKVLDASAVLVLLNGEKGAAEAAAEIEAGPCIMSSVNYAEVLSKMVERGAPESDLAAVRSVLRFGIVDATVAQAEVASRLRTTTRALGLSLGDRFCLALAQEVEGAIVVTADRVWKSLKGYRFKFVR